MALDPMQPAGVAQTVERLQEQTGGQAVDNTVGVFSSELEYSEELSAKAGEPVHIRRDYCYVRVPGKARENMKALVRKVFPDGTEVYVSEYHAKKYPRAWEAFLRGEDLRPPGTMLEDCPAIPRSRLAALKQAQIQTVEELISVPDSNLRRIGHDARALQKAGADWLEERNSVDTMRDEIAELRAKLAKMEASTDGDDQGDAPKHRRRNRDHAA